MQLRCSALCHHHAPSHMSKNRHPRVQLQEGESGQLVGLVSGSPHCLGGCSL